MLRVFDAAIQSLVLSYDSQQIYGAYKGHEAKKLQIDCSAVNLWPSSRFWHNTSILCDTSCDIVGSGGKYRLIQCEEKEAQNIMLVSWHQCKNLFPIIHNCREIERIVLSDDLKYYVSILIAEDDGYIAIPEDFQGMSASIKVCSWQKGMYELKLSTYFGKHNIFDNYPNSIPEENREHALSELKWRVDRRQTIESLREECGRLESYERSCIGQSEKYREQIDRMSRYASEHFHRKTVCFKVLPSYFAILERDINEETPSQFIFQYDDGSIQKAHEFLVWLV